MTKTFLFYLYGFKITLPHFTNNHDRATICLKSRNYVFKMTIFKTLLLYCTVYTGTCICSY